MDRFQVSVSGQPMAAEATSLIEKESLAMLFHLIL